MLLPDPRTEQVFSRTIRSCLCRRALDGGCGSEQSCSLAASALQAHLVNVGIGLHR